jgi:hypothetical protein
MNKKQIKQEFKKIDHEFRFNKPDFAPYPPDLVKRRELLLFAQVHLANVLGAKLENDEKEEKYQESLYRAVMSMYDNWNKNG